MSMRRWSIAVLFLAFPLAAQPVENVQVLTGLSRPEIQRVMNEMRAGLGVHCHYCHAPGADAKSDVKPEKRRAREMIRMVMDLNARHFGGKPVVTCFTCHNGKPRPALMPPLPQAVPAEPVPAEAKALPALATVVQKYVSAVGRELPLSAPRRVKGTSKSPTGPAVPVTIVEAGETARVDVQLPDGTMLTRVYDGNGGWIRDKNGVHDMSAEELVIARLSRRPFTPFHTTALGEEAHVVDSEKIGERNAWVVATPNARYWFDAESGLLLRRVVQYDSAVGRIPEQTDFDDYRDAGGFRLPFTIRVALVDPWLGGVRQLESVQTGVKIEPAEFEKP